MLIGDREKLGELLAKTAAALDIPDHVYEDTTLKYEDIGSWLAAADSRLRPYSPQIYPQGSFRLGTVVRPISEEDEYDIDLVCHLEMEKEQTTQEDLKQTVGDRLRARKDLAAMLEPKRRCWRLNYPSEHSIPPFHMDILPAIPNREHPPTGILITDRELTEWQKSNPQAYADWFYDRMKTVFLERKASIAESIEASVDDVPDWRVRTPLQITIQVLKRHRDICFRNDPEHKPISIIITTLAARAYRNQGDVYDALVDIIREMPAGIEKRNGKWWIPNPVDPEENFADKWNEDPKLPASFGDWLHRAQNDLASAGEKMTLREAARVLTPVLGESAIASAATDMGVATSLKSLVTRTDAQVPALGDAQHCQRPKWIVQDRYKAKVTGSVHHSRTRGRLWGLTNRPVPKEVSLKFTVTTNTPPPYEVQWQVVNTGQEAIAAGGLRGDFYPSDGVHTGTRWESTLYRGTHWIEAFIIKDGVCVARSGRKTVRIR